jgi:hypothetical protein
MKFGMHTPEGDEYVTRIVRLCRESHDRGSDMGPFLRLTMAQVAKIHPEVYDTVVREAIAGAVGGDYDLVRALSRP